MKEITEEVIFDLLDGKLADEEKADVLRRLPDHPELERLYRSLLMTEGYIRAHAVEKPSPDFTNRVADKLQRMINQKKRNGILYRALSLVGIVMVASIIGAVSLAGNAPAESSSPITDNNVFVTITTQLNSVLSFMSADLLRNIFMVLVAFTFFVFLDRVLIRQFSMKG